jgi:hypothetical protein
VNRFFITSLFVLACAVAQVVSAQSTDQSLPTPVLSNDVNGKIVALDVGDPRATRHFYALAGSPGDLIVTVDSKNLDGDIDVFTAITFRPLLKTTVYASSQSPAVTKGIYLRAHQLLILRIEARTPNDDPGTYHIHFGGTFEPFSGGIPVAENTEPTDSSTTKSSGNRLSSVGATLPRPPPEITETAEAKPSPSPEKPAEKASDTTESTKPEADKSKPTTARTTTTRPPRRSTRPTNSRRPPARKTEPAKKSEGETAAAESKTQPAQTEPAQTDAAKIEKSTAEKSSTIEKSAESTTPAEKAKPQEITSQLSGTRLIIEEKDGTRIERPMSTVRRVVIEGSTIVVLLKSGKTERIAMADVVRMAIEPQQ